MEKAGRGQAARSDTDEAGRRRGRARSGRREAELARADASGRLQRLAGDRLSGEPAGEGAAAAGASARRRAGGGS